LAYPPHVRVDDLIQDQKFVTDATGRVVGPGKIIPRPIISPPILTLPRKEPNNEPAR
jgi:hypothetical protein